MNDIIVYHGWYYWKRGSSCVYSFQYYRQHYFLSLGGGRKPHLPKMWEPSCRKNPSKTEQRTVVVLEFIKRELATFKTVIFFSILHHSRKLMPTFLRTKNRPGPVFRMWAQRQQRKKKKRSKIQLVQYTYWFVQKLPDPGIISPMKRNR